MFRLKDLNTRLRDSHAKVARRSRGVRELRSCKICKEEMHSKNFSSWGTTHGVVEDRFTSWADRGMSLHSDIASSVEPSKLTNCNKFALQ